MVPRFPNCSDKHTQVRCCPPDARLHHLRLRMIFSLKAGVPEGVHN